MSTVPDSAEPVRHSTWPTYERYDAAADPSLGTSPGVPWNGVQPSGYQPPDALELPTQTLLEDPTAGGALPGHQPKTFGQRIWRPGPPCENGACETGGSPPWIVPYETKLRTTVLPGNGDDLGLVNLDGRLTLAMPRVPGLTVTPGAIVTFVDGPIRTDLPSDLYSVWVELQYMKKLSPRWALQFAVAPGLYTDFEEVDSDAVRITGRALAFYGLSQQTQIAFGVVYLDRENVSALPAVGLIHQPSESVRYEVIFPRPRALFRVKKTATGEGWLYLAGEFGGGSWSIQRESGASDVVTYGDLRFIAGYEWRNGDKRKVFVEGGWVFEREVEYDSGLGDFDPNQTGLIRAGVSF